MYPRNSSAKTQFGPHWTCQQESTAVRHCQVAPRGNLTILRTHSKHHGFWKTIKLTPGEVALKKKYRLLCSKSASPVRTNKTDPIVTTWTSQKYAGSSAPRSSTSRSSSRAGSSQRPNSRVSTTPTSSRPLIRAHSSMHIAARGHTIDSDPDKLDMSQIMQELHTSVKPPDPVVPKSGMNPATALELALRSATRIPPKPDNSRTVYYQNLETLNGQAHQQDEDNGCPFCILQAEASRRNMVSIQTPSLGPFQSHPMKRSISARDRTTKRTTDEGPAATSKSLSVFNNSLPLEFRSSSQPQSPRYEQADRTTKYGPEFKYSHMPLTPAEWVKILKANPGDPILNRCDGEFTKPKCRSPVKLPSIHDKSDGETDSPPVTFRMENRPSHQQHPRPGPHSESGSSWRHLGQDMSSGKKLNAPNNTPEPSLSSSPTTMQVSFEDMHISNEDQHSSETANKKINYEQTDKPVEQTQTEEDDEGIELDSENAPNTERTSDPATDDDDDNAMIIKVDIVVSQNKTFQKPSLLT